MTRVDLDEIDVLLLYGGVESRLIEVPGPYRAEALALLENPNPSQFTEGSKLRTLLQEQGILVPEKIDELSFLKSRYEKVRFTQSESLGLTICPTLDCNFRCIYCYQHHPHSIMPSEVQEKVIQFVKARKPSVTSLSVIWFGGEPLLALTVIERLSRRFVNLQGGNIKYQASIITNGYLLTPDASRLLAELQIRNVQITLDGPREIHNRRRPLKGSQPTFDKIVENIASADSRLQIVVRVNIDAKNVERASELFDQLDSAGLRGRIGVYFAPVIQLQLAALNRGYEGPGLPQSKPHVCIADSIQGIVISPNGLVFKCWNDVTQPQNAVFDISTGKQTQSMEKMQSYWMGWSPFSLPECIDCKILPQCMGGCPYLGLRQKQGQTKHGYCSDLKDNLSETLATYYLANRRRKDAKQLMRSLHQWLPFVVPNPENLEKGSVEEKK
jgi:uncharacterized protein